MPFQLNDAVQQQALASLERYFREHMNEPIGNVAAAGLLKFFLHEIAPAAYNQGVADAQAQMQQRVSELDIDVYQEGFTFWQAQGRRR